MNSPVRVDVGARRDHAWRVEDSNRNPPANRQAPSIAVGLLVAAVIAFGFVLLCLMFVSSGNAVFAIPGSFGALPLILFAQLQFAETHRRNHHRWSVGALFSPGWSAEKGEAMSAWTRRDPVRVVETSRLVGIGMLLFAFAAFAAFMLTAAG